MGPVECYAMHDICLLLNLAELRLNLVDPKSEALNPKQIQNTSSPMFKTILI